MRRKVNSGSRGCWAPHAKPRSRTLQEPDQASHFMQLKRAEASGSFPGSASHPHSLPVLQRFGQMRRGDLLPAGQVSNRPRQFEDSMVAARGQR